MFIYFSSINLTWYDSRLTFNNLKLNKTGGNILKKEVTDQIWMPTLDFTYCTNDYKIPIDDFSLVAVIRDGEYSLCFQQGQSNLEIQCYN